MNPHISAGLENIVPFTGTNDEVPMKRSYPTKRKLSKSSPIMSRIIRFRVNIVSNVSGRITQAHRWVDIATVRKLE